MSAERAHKYNWLSQSQRADPVNHPHPLKGPTLSGLLDDTFQCLFRHSRVMFHGQAGNLATFAASAYPANEKNRRASIRIIRNQSGILLSRIETVNLDRNFTHLALPTRHRRHKGHLVTGTYRVLCFNQGLVYGEQHRVGF